MMLLVLGQFSGIICCNVPGVLALCRTPIGMVSKKVATSTKHFFETGCRRGVNSMEAIGSTETSGCYLETIYTLLAAT